MSNSTMSRRTFAAALGLTAVAGLGLLSGCGSSTETAEETKDDAETKTDAAEGAEEKAADGGADAEASGDEPVLIEAGKVIVGSDCDYPPFTTLDGDQAAGFEYDIMCAVCDEIGLTCEYHTPLKFDTLVAAVAAGGTIDVAVSAITITEERKEEVDFTDPYFDSNQSVTVLKDSGYTSSADLKGKNIAVQSGTTGEAWAKENIADATVTAFDEAPAAFAALQAKKADAVIVDLPVAVEMLNGSYDSCAIIEEVATGEQYGIAVAKTNPGLTKLLNEGLSKIRESGKYQEIYDKYFSVK